MTILALTIDATTIALWTTLGTVIIGGLGTLAGAAVKEYFTIRGQIADLKKATDANTSASTANTATAAAHDATINSLMVQTSAISLATPPAQQAPVAHPRQAKAADGSVWQLVAAAPAIDPAAQETHGAPIPAKPAPALVAAHAGVMPPVTFPKAKP